MNTAPVLETPSQSRPGTLEFHFKAVERVINVLHQQTENHLSIEEMARIAFISPYHFIRVFQEITGTAPCRFQCALKLQAAKRLLQTTEMKVIDVCYEVGYNSLGTFTRRFSELVGVPPKRFRVISRDLNHAWNAASPATAPSGEHPMATQIMGRVMAPEEFSGNIVVGLFSTRIPQGVPAACAVANRHGEFVLQASKVGFFYALAIGIPSPPIRGLMEDEVLRGEAGNNPIHVGTGAPECIAVDIALRPARSTDPPILTAVNALVRQPKEISTMPPLREEERYPRLAEPGEIRLQLARSA